MGALYEVYVKLGDLRAGLYLHAPQAAGSFVEIFKLQAVTGATPDDRLAYFPPRDRTAVKVLFNV